MLRTLLFVSVCLSACSGGGANDPFATYQACFDEHHTTESLSINDSIVVCCLDHPIAGVRPACGNTATDCIAYVGANLSTGATAQDIQGACSDYISKKGM